MYSNGIQMLLYCLSVSFINNIRPSGGNTLDLSRSIMERAVLHIDNAVCIIAYLYFSIFYRFHFLCLVSY